ncbi:MAG: DNA alkylation response protein, partial [Marinobacter sp.]
MNAPKSNAKMPTKTHDDRYLATTHDVVNQPPALENYNLYGQDTALQEAVKREGAGNSESDLEAFGAFAGNAATIDLGFRANNNKPTFNTHDRFGHRIDEVDFHPAYHELMRIAFENGLHSSPWTNPGKGAHVTRAAKYYMHSQVEA